VVTQAQNHQHGEVGPDGLNARLVTKYGGPVAVTLTTQPEAPVPGEPYAIAYTLKDKNGSPVTPDKLSAVHEHLMHLIVVSQDLNHFAHIHPQDAGAGRYSVTDTLSTADRYLLFNEFVTSDGVTQIERHEVDAAGAALPGVRASLSPGAMVPQGADGLTVNVTPPPKTRRRVASTYMLTVSRDGRPVTSLEPYLGAACHVVAISENTTQFAHTHCDTPGMGGTSSMGNMGSIPMPMPMPTPPPNFGPNLQFTHTFMQPGPYRVWAQFGYEGRVVTVAFDVMVEK
jgi:hypothetical protein